MFGRNNLILYVLASVIGASVELAVHVGGNVTVLREPALLYIGLLVVLALGIYLSLSFLIAAFLSLIRVRRFTEHGPFIVVGLVIGGPLFYYSISPVLPPSPVIRGLLILLLALSVPPVLILLVKLLNKPRFTKITVAAFASAFIIVLAALTLIPRLQTDVIPDEPNVLLITVDTVRADHIGVYGYEKGGQSNIKALAENGVVVPFATCEVPVTAPSHATMMTSLPAAAHGVLLNIMYLNDDVPVLAEFFKDAGYSTVAVIGGSPLWGRDTGLDRGFDIYDDAMSPSEEFTRTPLITGKTAEKLGFLRYDGRPLERTADEVTDAVLKTLERGLGRPYFMWVHYYDAHDEYLPPAEFAPAGLEDKRSQRDINEDWSANENPRPEDTEKIIALYDGEIEFVDHEIGVLLAGLDVKGMLENTVICLVSDHGEGLLDHDTKYHGLRVYGEDIKIPLIFSSVGCELPPLRVGAGFAASTLDVAPTLLELAGLPVPVSMRGRSLFSPGPDRAFGYSLSVPDPKRDTPISRGRLDAVYSENYKFIVSSKGTVELYDLANDPGEQSNIAGYEPAVVADMNGLLEEYLAKIPPVKIGPRDLNAERLETLKGLGYLE
jgi:arylsulfatase A-like enzyme